MPHSFMHWPPVGLLQRLAGSDAPQRCRQDGALFAAMRVCASITCRTGARACCLSAVLLMLLAQLLTGGPAYLETRPYPL